MEGKEAKVGKVNCERYKQLCSQVIQAPVFKFIILPTDLIFFIAF